MARVAHVRVDAAVGAVGPSSLLRRLVDLDVLDDQVAGVEAFRVGVRFGVLEQTKQELGGLDWVPRSRDAELFACVVWN